MPQETGFDFRAATTPPAALDAARSTPLACAVEAAAAFLGNPCAPPFDALCPRPRSSVLCAALAAPALSHAVNDLARFTDEVADAPDDALGIGASGMGPPAAESRALGQTGPLRQDASPPLPSTASAPLGTVRRVFGETLEPAANPSNPAAWKTSEYSRSTTIDSVTGASRLNLIHAAEGYARRITGRPGGGGITVAVIDDGIDDTHLQLDVAKAFEYGSVGRSHGTGMAGVIAARRDGDGVHGVAYNANLISLARVSEDATVNQSAADIASAAGLVRTYGSERSNPDGSAHILNMSWGEIGQIPAIRSAMRDAASAGRIMVSALGNNGGTEPTGAPAIHSADEGIAGFAIAVGWLNLAGTARHTNTDNCGVVARYCLFAPGTRVLTTAVGGGEMITNGSSNSTAYVSGAAAVVWAAFPNKRGDQVVGRLLSTARPLDGQEISSTYGHGALDLGAAINPVGFLSLSLNGARVPLAASFIRLPPGFAAPAPDAALASAVVYDRQTFPFLADLNTVFRTSRGLPFWWLSQAAPPNVAGVPRADAEQALMGWPSPVGLAAAGPAPTYRLEVRPTPRVGLAFSNGLGAVAVPGDAFASWLGRTALGSPFAVAPYAAVAGSGKGFGIGWQIGRGTALHFASKRGNGHWDAAHVLGSAKAALVSAGFVQRFGALTLGADYGLLDERRSLLGVRAAGAFAGLRDVATAFVNLRFEVRVTPRSTLFGSVSRGATAGGAGQGGLIAGWDATRTRSSLLGGEVAGLFAESDRLTLTVSTPLRSRQASLRLQVPHREVADGIVEYVTRTVDLSPKGRELRFQLAYAGTAMEERLAFSLGLHLRLQPDHLPSAAPEAGMGLTVRFTH